VVEHFEWLEPMFNERLEIADGRLVIPNRPGLGLPLSEQTAAWTADSIKIG
jgi:L-alanine-DL-glutamate epimerase-like enolase superfamily enzyme